MNWILIQHQEWNSTCRNRLILTRCVYSEISQEDSGKEGLEQARSLGFLNAAVWLPLPVQQEPESPGFQDNDVNILDEAIPKTQRQWICKRINNECSYSLILHYFSRIFWSYTVVFLLKNQDIKSTHSKTKFRFTNKTVDLILNKIIFAI